jgi:hypothetical protein
MRMSRWPVHCVRGWILPTAGWTLQDFTCAQLKSGELGLYYCANQSEFGDTVRENCVGTCATPPGEPACTAQCNPGSWTDDAATNFFTADCSGVTEAGAACTLTVDDGYEAGEVKCIAPAYTVTPAAFASACDPAGVDWAAWNAASLTTNFFSADCTGVTTVDSPCAFAYRAGYYQNDSKLTHTLGHLW